MKIQFITLFLLVLSGCQNMPEIAKTNSNQETSKTNLSKADDEWNETRDRERENPKYQTELQKELRESATEAKIINLKDKKIGANEMEIRIWQFHSHFYPEIFVYNRKGNIRNAMFIKSDSKDVNHLVKLNAPKSGWENFDDYLKNELKINENMKFSTKGERPPVPDGGSIFIEVKTDKSYENESFLFPSTAFDGIKFNDFYKKINDEFEINKKSGIQIAGE